MKHSVHFPSLHLIKKILYLCAFLVLVTATVNAQTSISPKTCHLAIDCQSPKKTITINFSSEKQVDNLLVRIADPLGNTVFLDNRYRFRGEYKKTVELAQLPKGDYSVEVINDDEKFSKHVSYDPNAK